MEFVVVCHFEFLCQVEVVETDNFSYKTPSTGSG